MAADVGGVSATANPVATSSGSVTNQAIQVLQGLILLILTEQVFSVKALHLISHRLLLIATHIKNHLNHIIKILFTTLAM